MVDVLSVAVRAASFVCLFQAAGAALFTVLYGGWLTGSLPRIGALARASAWAGLAAVAVHGLLQPARMAGELAGIFDPTLERLFLTSSAGAATGVRLLALVLVAVAAGRRAVWPRVAALAGLGLGVLSFLLTGHTSVSPVRWALAPLLGLHLLVVAFWFGALAPLAVVIQREPAAVAGAVLAAFSAAAAWLVPGMLLAALGIAVGLIPDVRVLGRPYGELLMTKLALFLSLMGLAALNKWRLAPAVGRSDARATLALRRSLVAEHVLISCALAVTAVMTAWFSPGPD